MKATLSNLVPFRWNLMGNYVSQAIEPAERVLCYFLVKIIAVVFDFYSSANWGEKEISTKGVSNGQKRGGVG